MMNALCSPRAELAMNGSCEASLDLLGQQRAQPVFGGGGEFCPSAARRLCRPSSTAWYKLPRSAVRRTPDEAAWRARSGRSACRGGEGRQPRRRAFERACEQTRTTGSARVATLSYASARRPNRPWPDGLGRPPSHREALRAAYRPARPLRTSTQPLHAHSANSASVECPPPPPHRQREDRRTARQVIDEQDARRARPFIGAGYLSQKLRRPREACSRKPPASVCVVAGARCHPPSASSGRRPSARPSRHRHGAASAWGPSRKTALRFG